ncbi:S9 family peptidase [Puia sp.]|uniref:S9 family peptidase n=1 Tax=Puia sp. TaxID=2045100 RepID=UPI002F4298E8
MRKALLFLLLPLQLVAQPTPFLAFKKYPFPTELTASPTGARIAWAMDEEGRRNIYVAEGPAYAPRKLTDFSKDDGQEITSISLSTDGSWVVFVRGGDHGANWEGGRPVNPAFETEAFKVQVASIPFAGGEVKYLSEGDEPSPSPDGKTVAFIKSNQVWTAPIDGSSAAKNAFTTRGNVGDLQWSPDGRRLLFVSSRSDHSIIGIYTPGLPTLKWIAPSFSRDESPQWSNDGSRIVFIRRPGTGGAPDSLLANRHLPWSLYVADTAAGKASLLWKAPATLRGSFPSTDGGANLHWADGNHIVFLSYHDGWPHLYSIDANAADGHGATTPSARGVQPLLLTPGNFMCEHIRLSAGRKYLVCSANTGTDPLDVERRHVLMVSIDKQDAKIMTPGEGLEWTPILTGDETALAFISATAQRPPLPAVLRLKDHGGRNITTLCNDRIPQDFPQSRLITPRAVTFTSADGVIVHADLFEPQGGKTRKPAIVYIHGGPPRQMLLGWHYSDYYSNAYASNQYLASLGFVVLAVNYRLGIGYGYEFHKPAKAGAAGASEYKDIKAAGEWLRKQHFVDTGRIGVYGGSYGGFLTAMALAKDSRLFAAGVDFHGVHSWLTQSSIFTAAKDRYEKAPDYEKALRTAWLSSPVSAIDTWRSPVLIIQGDDDRNVRFSESVDLIRRLEKKGVPYESLMIVDDTHHWMNFANAVTVYAAAADFFVRKFMN